MFLLLKHLPVNWLECKVILDQTFLHKCYWKAHHLFILAADFQSNRALNGGTLKTNPLLCPNSDDTRATSSGLWGGGILCSFYPAWAQIRPKTRIKNKPIMLLFCWESLELQWQVNTTMEMPQYKAQESHMRLQGPCGIFLWMFKSSVTGSLEGVLPF